jgi:phage terminase small subunit
MARTRKPTAILEQNGSFDHDPARARARENEPVPSGPLGAPPSFFSEAEARVWREVSEQVPEGVLTVADRMFMEMFCRLFARERAGEDLKAAERNLILSCLSRMGFTPADRTKLSAPTQKKQDAEDTFARLANYGRRSTDVKQ